MDKRLFCKFKNIRSPQHRGEKILLSTLSILKKETNNPQGKLLTAIKNLRPGVKLTTQIRSGKIVPLPAYQSESSANYFAIKWLYNAAKERTSKSFEPHDLVDEINDTLRLKGRAFKSKLDLIKEIRDSRVNLRKSFKRFKRFKRKPFRRKVWDPKTKKWKDPINVNYKFHALLRYRYEDKRTPYPAFVSKIYKARYKRYYDLKVKKRRKLRRLKRESEK